MFNIFRDMLLCWAKRNCRRRLAEGRRAPVPSFGHLVHLVLLYKGLLRHETSGSARVKVVWGRRRSWSASNERRNEQRHGGWADGGWPSLFHTCVLWSLCPYCPSLFKNFACSDHFVPIVHLCSRIVPALITQEPSTLLQPNAPRGGGNLICGTLGVLWRRPTRNCIFL